MRYRARTDKLVRVQGITVTDHKAGVKLRETACVAEHVRLGRLIPVAKNVEKSQRKPRKAKGHTS